MRKYRDMHVIFKTEFLTIYFCFWIMSICQKVKLKYSKFQEEEIINLEIRYKILHFSQNLTLTYHTAPVRTPMGEKRKFVLNLGFIPF